MANNFKNLKATKFLSMLSARQERFESAKAEMPQTSDQAMVIAKALHPKKQFLVVESIRDMSADIIFIELLNDAVKLVNTLACFDNFSFYFLELLFIFITLFGTSFLIEHLGIFSCEFCYPSYLLKNNLF